jgi:hypothetical protein
MVEGHFIGNRNDVAGRHCDALGIPPRAAVANHLAGGAELLETPAAVFAGSATDLVVNTDAIALSEIPDRRSGCGYDAGHLMAQSQR